MYNWLVTGCIVAIGGAATLYAGRQLVHARTAPDPWPQVRAAAAVWVMAVGACFVAANTLTTLGARWPSTSFLSRYQINLVPFRSLAGLAGEVVWGTGPAFRNLIGNLVLFAPVGVGLGLHPTVSLRMGTAVALAGPAVIEVAQIFLPRSTDVDDLLLNFIGATTALLATRVGLHGARMLRVSPRNG